MADEKIIFSMNGVSKILPHNNKAILKKRKKEAKKNKGKFSTEEAIQ